MSNVIRCGKKRLLLYIVIISLFLITFSSYFLRSRKSGDKKKGRYFESENTQTKRVEKLKLSPDDVPVVIVDEHQEVIPHWYQAVEEGLIKSEGNTLIHIDGHSDMALPSVYGGIKAFKHRIPPSNDMFLPLMQSNDVFIVSAIMKGLIKHVFWVTPKWMNSSKYTVVMRSYVGVTSVKGNQTICMCKKLVMTKVKSTRPFYCTYPNQKAKVIEELEISIDQTDCKMIRRFTLIKVSEEKFIKLVNLTKVKNLFIDIDEDYFGVQSGVQSFIDQGLSLVRQNEIDEILMTLYCPETTEGEQEINKQLQKLFLNVFKHRMLKKENIVQATKELLLSTNMCNQLENRDLFMQHISDYISMLSLNEIKILSRMKYCLLFSPQLKAQDIVFTLCHGNIYPGDRLNEIYVSGEKEIAERAKNLENILNFINQFAQAKFYTIARSLRDGYTPRKQQHIIEKTLLQILDNVILKHGKQKRIIYDKQLLFGEKGWA